MDREAAARMPLCDAVICSDERSILPRNPGFIHEKNYHPTHTYEADLFSTRSLCRFPENEPVANWMNGRRRWIIMSKKLKP